MEYDNAIITGMQTILDLNGVTIGHFMQMTPSVIKKMVVTTQVSAYKQIYLSRRVGTRIRVGSIFIIVDWIM